MIAPLGLACVVATLGAAAVSADTPPRCLVTGQMAVSTWLDLLGGLATAKAEDVDPAIHRLDALTRSYAVLGCDIDQLGKAMDCLVTGSGSATSRDLARRCMAEAGITGDS